MAATQQTTKQQEADQQETGTDLMKVERRGPDVVADLWYDFARGGQKATLEALRQFVNAVPMQGGKDSRRRKLIDGAFAIADQAGAMPLGMARGAMRSAMVVYVDVAVNVKTDVDAFRDINVGVNVPTDVDVKELL